MKNIRDFIKLESSGAKLLLSATFLALILSNSPWNNIYENIFFNTILIATKTLHLNLKFFINEVLMTIFFLVVGLEIKFEFLKGELNTYRKALLPIIAAVGGMIFPAIIYAALNYQNDHQLKGWAIPTATDIAFALGVLSLLGSRVVPALKSFLTTLAIMDDLIAIIIIATFYTLHISWFFLGCALICILILIAFNQKKINTLVPYCVLGVILWFCLLLSGVHPTLAGVLLSFTIPLESKNLYQKSPSYQLKKFLHPFVTLIILPLFAFANAGISLKNVSVENLQFSILLGVIAGLFLGKQLGIFTSCWLATKLRIAHLPSQVKWRELYAVSIICGIGFTISLFVGTLAFGESHSIELDSVKIGILLGSFLSGLVGYLFFRLRNK